MSQEVNFSDLTTEKKKEFLNFLLSNNIKFEEGTDNYVARVTLNKNMKKDNKDQKENRQIRRSASPNQKSNSKQTTQGYATPNSMKKKPLQSATPTQENKQKTSPRQKIVSPLTLKQKQTVQSRSSNMISPASQRENAKVETEALVERGRSRSKSATSKKQEPPSQPQVRPKVSQSQLSGSKTKINTSLQLTKPINIPNQIATQQPPPKRQTSTTPPHQTTQSPKPAPFHPQPPSYPPQKLQQLIDVLHITSFGFRPTRWPRTQVLKTIQQIYSGNFAKNTLLLKHRKFKEAYDKGSCTFSSYVVEHFEEKYRTGKLLHSHLLNLCHSLLSCIYQGTSSPNGPNCSLTMFHLFLTEEYEYQDLVFFLFIRSIFEKEFNITMDKISVQQHILTKKEVGRFIRAILGKDSPDIVLEFQNLVAEHMGETIHLYALYQVLLEDYQIKRKQRVSSHFYQSDPEAAYVVSQKNQFQQAVAVESKAPPLSSRHKATLKSATQASDNSLFHEESQSNIEQLTFGEYNVSASCREIEQDQTQFWNDFEPIQLSSQNDPVLEQLQQKLKKKVQELVQIMLGDESCSRDGSLKGPAKQLGKLILGKAIRMLQAIIAMDKIRWFRLIRIHKPNQTHLQTVQSLQMMLRNIRRLSKDNQPQARTLQSEFCKSLLTVQQLRRALQRIVIG